MRRTAKLHFHRARNGEFAWRIVGANGKKLHWPGETFKTAYGSIRNFVRVAEIFQSGSFVLGSCEGVKRSTVEIALARGDIVTA